MQLRSGNVIKIAPSILAADFSCLASEVEKIEKYGADYVHIDVMDGHFVPNITFGPSVVKSLRKCTGLVFDVHLMIEHPEKYVDAFLKAGSDIITVHIESDMDYDYVKNAVKSAGKKLALSIKPKTDVKEVLPYLGNLDMVLIMSVEPGFGGQKFIPDMLKKAEYIRSIDKNIDIEMDGGIDLTNIAQIVKSGVNVVVAGSSVYGSSDIKKTIEEFKKY